MGRAQWRANRMIYILFFKCKLLFIIAGAAETGLVPSVDRAQVTGQLYTTETQAIIPLNSIKSAEFREN